MVDKVSPVKLFSQQLHAHTKFQVAVNTLTIQISNVNNVSLVCTLHANSEDISGNIEAVPAL
jgi:hypothetical protein